MKTILIEMLPNGLEAIKLEGNLTIILIAIALVLATVVLILHFKKIIINSILGAIGWGIAIFVFKVSIPFIPSLIASLIFGLAGIGVVLVFAFFGVI
ncbi:MAG: hypothetical protein ABIA76_01340 [Candidatus Diapherotrites archaeon]